MKIKCYKKSLSDFDFRESVRKSNVTKKVCRTSIFMKMHENQMLQKKFVGLRFS
jgi:hypothetical protein